jgi:hypothetical protein
MKSLLPLAAAAALFLGFSAPAAAGDMVRLETVGPWQIYGNETLCRAQSPFVNGTTLYFYVNAQNGVSIAISNPKWRIPEGSYEVFAQVDRTPPGRMAATAKDGWLIFGIAATENDINLLAYGKTLYVTVGAQTYQYHLAGSAAMLTALAVCADTRPAAADPFGNALSASTPPSPNPFAETASNPYRRM